MPATASGPTTLAARNTRTGATYPGTLGPQLALNALDRDGDTIEVTPGIYAYADSKPYGGHIYSNYSVTVRSSVPGTKFILDLGGSVADGRLYSVVGIAANKNLTLEDCEARNNRVLYGAVSGIWTDGGTQTIIVRRCWFHDLNNGIIVGQNPLSTVLVEDTQFNDCGDNVGQGHNIYIGPISSFTMRGCWSHETIAPGDPGHPSGPPNGNVDVSFGHLVKSRAKVTVIEGCRLTMERGNANRCIDLPNGGDVTVRGCLLEINAGNANKLSQGIYYGQFLSFGVEEHTNFAAHWTVNKLHFEQNTCVNHNGAAVHFAMLDTLLDNGITTWSVKDNVFAGFVKHRAAVGQASYIQQVYNGRTNVATDANYEISETDNTFITAANMTRQIPGHAAFDFALATPVVGSQNWATRKYVHPTSNVPRTDNLRGAV